jgi:hypothetical protein
MVRCFFRFRSYLGENIFCSKCKNCLCGLAESVVPIMKTSHVEILQKFPSPWYSSKGFSKNFKIRYFTKYEFGGYLCPMQTDRDSDRYKSRIKNLVAFRNYLANAGVKMFQNCYTSLKIKCCNQGILDGRARLCL